MRRIAATFHRFEAVLDRVIEDLLDLVAIEFEPRQIGTQLGLDHDVAILDLGLEKTAPIPRTIAFTSSGRRCGFEGRIARRNWVTIESSRLISARAMSIDSCSSRRSSAARKFLHFPLHQLQMDVE